MGRLSLSASVSHTSSSPRGGPCSLLGLTHLPIDGSAHHLHRDRHRGVGSPLWWRIAVALVTLAVLERSRSLTLFALVFVVVAVAANLYEWRTSSPDSAGGSDLERAVCPNLLFPRLCCSVGRWASRWPTVDPQPQRAVQCLSRQKRLMTFVHQRVRLGILTICHESRRVEFSYLQHTLGLTAGNLSRHLQILEEAGLVKAEKTINGRKVKTWVVHDWCGSPLAQDRSRRVARDRPSS